uniref:ATP-dependent DNA helicase n=1 Tax=Ditylenchus dipsaci TaxID=166011 RepID=A0A915E6V6_9BILA
MNKKVTNTAFSGIAATLLPKGKTNHNMLKLPVPLDGHSVSRIDLNSAEARELRDVDIIVWDEAPMAPKQVMPVKEKAISPEEIIELCIKSSPLWKQFEVIELTENKRADPKAKQLPRTLLILVMAQVMMKMTCHEYDAGKERVYNSVDTAENWKGPPPPPEVLKKFVDANFAQPVLKLKVNSIVILLRNLNIDKGLCNGTRMRILDMGEDFSPVK